MEATFPVIRSDFTCTDQTTNNPTEEPGLVRMTQIVFPNQTQHYGTAFGGIIFSWIDVTAVACAMKHCGTQVVTASVDRLYFLSPIHVGWIVTLEAQLVATHRTSCEVFVKGFAGSPLRNHNVHAVSAFLTLVAIDEQGNPAPIPTLKECSPKTRMRNQLILEKRTLRLQEKRQLLDPKVW